MLYGSKTQKIFKKPLVKSFVANGLFADNIFGVLEEGICGSLVLVDDVPNIEGDPLDVLIEPLACENLAGVFCESDSWK